MKFWRATMYRMTDETGAQFETVSEPAMVCSQCGTFTDFGECENCGVMSYTKSVRQIKPAFAEMQSAPHQDFISPQRKIEQEISNQRLRNAKALAQGAEDSARAREAEVLYSAYMLELERQFWDHMRAKGYPGGEIITVYAVDITDYGSSRAARRELKREQHRASQIPMLRGWKLESGDSSSRVCRDIYVLSDKKLVSVDTAYGMKIGLHDYDKAKICSHANKNTPMGWRNFMIDKLAWE
jgi:hypothetical protein